MGYIKNPCATLTPQKITDADLVFKGIQKFYAPLQALVAMGVNIPLPGAGPLVANGIAGLLAGADVALNNLGTIIASNCANDAQVTLAQILLNSLEGLFNTPEIQKVLTTPQYKMQLKRISSVPTKK
jgi:hypothetical protein